MFYNFHPAQNSEHGPTVSNGMKITFDATISGMIDGGWIVFMNPPYARKGTHRQQARPSLEYLLTRYLLRISAVYIFQHPADYHFREQPLVLVRLGALSA
jgi:hypothetical protein